MSIRANELKLYLNDLLNITQFSDYGPNGLQIEGRTEIEKIAFAVSATKDSIEKAIAFGAHALIVHHGLFWKFHGVRTLTGPFAKRVLPLVRNEINLFGYHLPLDAHPRLGNAAQIAMKLSLLEKQPFGDHKGSPTGVSGNFKEPISSHELKTKLENILNHSVLHSDPGEKKIKSIGIITGGANGDWTHCLHEGIDAYLTGEMSEHDWNEAKEAGIHFYAGGHHATERFGILALKEHIETTFGLDSNQTLFIDSDNPA